MSAATRKLRSSAPQPSARLASTRVEPAILQRIGAQLVDQADAAALLREIEQHAGALLGHAPDRAAQLRAAVAAQAAQQVAGEAFGMEPHQRRVGLLGTADQDGEMLDARVRRPEGDDARIGRAISGTAASATRVSRPAIAAG